MLLAAYKHPNACTTTEIGLSVHIRYNGLFTDFNAMPGTIRNKVTIGAQVSVVQKHHQRSGELTRGTVAKILTNSPNHPHGIKVKLDSGTVGRVKAIHD